MPQNPDIMVIIPTGVAFFLSNPYIHKSSVLNEAPEGGRCNLLLRQGIIKRSCLGQNRPNNVKLAYTLQL